jgi:hypothetical protein
MNRVAMERQRGEDSSGMLHALGLPAALVGVEDAGRAAAPGRCSRAGVPRPCCPSLNESSAPRIANRRSTQQHYDPQTSRQQSRWELNILCRPGHYPIELVQSSFRLPGCRWHKRPRPDMIHELERHEEGGNYGSTLTMNCCGGVLMRALVISQPKGHPEASAR